MKLDDDQVNFEDKDLPESFRDHVQAVRGTSPKLLGVQFGASDGEYNDSNDKKNVKIKIDTAKIIENLPDVDCDLNLLDIA